MQKIIALLTGGLLGFLTKVVFDEVGKPLHGTPVTGQQDQKIPLPIDENEKEVGTV